MNSQNLPKMKRNIKLQVLLTEKEYKEIDFKAKECEMSLSQFVRFVLLKSKIHIEVG